MVFVNRPELIQRYAPFIPGIPTPAQDWDEFPKICVTFNQTWIPLIIGAMETLRWPDLYSDDQGRAEHIAMQAQALIDAFSNGNIPCMGGDVYLLRQKPGSPCVLEQSVDNGLTWIVAFDYGLCSISTTPSTLEMDILVSNSFAWISNQQTIYNNDITNVAPGLVYDGTDDDDIRDKAMCFAVNQFIVMIADMEELRQQQGLDWWDYANLLVKAIGGGAVLVLGLATIPGVAVPVLAVQGATLAASLATAGKVFLEVFESNPDITSILDSDLQRELTCCAASSLGGSTPSSSQFASMFDGCDIPEITDDTLEILQSIVEDERLYLAFLETINKAFDALQDGQEYDCLCSEWERTFDFTVDDGGFSVVPGINDFEAGTYVAGTGWSSGYDEKVTGLAIQLAFAVQNCSVLELRLDYTYFKASAPDWSTANVHDFIRIQYSNTDGTDAGVSRLSATADQGENSLHWEGAHDVNPLHGLAAQVITMVDYGGTEGDGSAVVHTLYVRGRGTPPAWAE